MIHLEWKKKFHQKEVKEKCLNLIKSNNLMIMANKKSSKTNKINNNNNNNKLKNLIKIIK